jgi:hypothetical protein
MGVCDGIGLASSPHVRQDIFERSIDEAVISPLISNGASLGAKINRLFHWAAEEQWKWFTLFLSHLAWQTMCQHLNTLFA